VIDFVPFPQLRQGGGRRVCSDPGELIDKLHPAAIIPRTEEPKDLDLSPTTGNRFTITPARKVVRLSSLARLRVRLESLI
jgi:hypothetical protein